MTGAASISFPSNVVGSGPVTIAKANGIWTVGFDASQIGIVGPGFDPNITDVLIWNPITKVWQTASISTILSVTGALAGLVNHTVLVGTGPTSAASLAAATNGQVLVGQTGLAPAWKTLSGAISISAAGVVSVVSINFNQLTGIASLVQGGLGGSQSAATVGQIPVFPGSGGAAVPTTLPTSRQLLTGLGTFYVLKTGSDSNSGTANTAGGGWLTIQHALDYISQHIDGGGNDIQVNIGDGIYSENPRSYYPFVGVRYLMLVGNVTTSTNCVLAGQSAGGDTLAMSVPGNTLTVKGLQISAAGANSDAIHCSGGVIWINGNMDFGTTPQNHMDADTRGQILITANYTVSGSAGSHFSASFGGFIQAVAGLTITLTGTPAFSNGFAEAADIGNIESSATFSGSATGQRYVSTRNANIFVSGAGATYFPGSIAGTATLGGQYN
jgi:hypothetical protein